MFNSFVNASREFFDLDQLQDAENRPKRLLDHSLEGDNPRRPARWSFFPSDRGAERQEQRQITYSRRNNLMMQQALDAIDTDDVVPLEEHNTGVESVGSRQSRISIQADTTRLFEPEGWDASTIRSTGSDHHTNMQFDVSQITPDGSVINSIQDNLNTSNMSVASSNMSVNSNQPKIKDQKASASMGARRNLVYEVDFKTESIMDFFISPRYDQPIEAIGATQDGQTPTRITVQMPFKDNHPIAKAYVVGDAPEKIKTDPASEISKIRMVAQETKFTVVNAADDNDGWFEAVRLTPHKDAKTYLTNQNSGNEGTPHGYTASPRENCFGNRDYNDGAIWQPNMSAKSGYVTGKLRNLHRLIWTNKRVTRECEFKDLPLNMLVGADAVDPEMVDQQTNSTANVAFHDWDYDVIWVRIHGKKAPATDGCCSATKIMVHLIQGVECVFGEQNMLHSYMSSNLPTYRASSRSMQKYKKRKYPRKYYGR